MSNAIRPGNREKGWNDPPEFLYTENPELLNQATTVNKKTILNQRMAHTFDSFGPSSPLATMSSPTPAAKPECIEKLMAPPTMLDVVNPVAALVSGADSSDGTVSSEQVNYSIEKIEIILNAKVQFLKDKGLSVKVCDDVLKRVKIFVSNWLKLNDKVKEKMSNLAQALENSQYSSADGIHVRLMLDFPSEVSQWMVGIKKLIHELINLSKAETDNKTEEAN